MTLLVRSRSNLPPGVYGLRVENGSGKAACWPTRSPWSRRRLIAEIEPDLLCILPGGPVHDRQPEKVSWPSTGRCPGPPDRVLRADGLFRLGLRALPAPRTRSRICATLQVDFPGGCAEDSIRCRPSIQIRRLREHGGHRLRIVPSRQVASVVPDLACVLPGGEAVPGHRTGFLEVDGSCPR